MFKESLVLPAFMSLTICAYFGIGSFTASNILSCFRSVVWEITARDNMMVLQNSWLRLCSMLEFIANVVCMAALFSWIGSQDIWCFPSLLHVNGLGLLVVESWDLRLSVLIDLEAVSARSWLQTLHRPLLLHQLIDWLGCVKSLATLLWDQIGSWRVAASVSRF